MRNGYSFDLPAALPPVRPYPAISPDCAECGEATVCSHCHGCTECETCECEFCDHCDSNVTAWLEYEDGPCCGKAARAAAVEEAPRED